MALKLYTNPFMTFAQWLVDPKEQKLPAAADTLFIIIVETSRV